MRRGVGAAATLDFITSEFRSSIGDVADPYPSRSLPGRALPRPVGLRLPVQRRHQPEVGGQLGGGSDVAAMI
jgi:hypothetical protein